MVFVRPLHCGLTVLNIKLYCLQNDRGAVLELLVKRLRQLIGGEYLASLSADCLAVGVSGTARHNERRMSTSTGAFASLLLLLLCLSPMPAADRDSIPTGALVGIALGALAVVLALGLLALIVRDRRQIAPAQLEAASSPLPLEVPPNRDATVSPFVLPQRPPPLLHSRSQWPAPNGKGAVGY